MYEIDLEEEEGCDWHGVFQTRVRISLSPIGSQAERQ